MLQNDKGLRTLGGRLCEAPAFGALALPIHSAGNFDGFFTVRVSDLIAQTHPSSGRLSPDGLTSKQQLEQAHAEATNLSGQLQERWSELREKLASEQIRIVGEDLSANNLVWLADHFIRHIFPAITPLSIDPAHPFPFIPNKSPVRIPGSLHREFVSKPLESALNYNL